MLEFWQDGKRVEILPIDGDGEVGQTVIYGENVSWEGLDPNLFSLSRYNSPTIFTIVKKYSYPEPHYILRDSKGILIIINYENHRYGAELLYDAQEWLTFISMRSSNNISYKQKKIEDLESHIQLLKDILIKQGTRIVTEKQAKELGL